MLTKHSTQKSDTSKKESDSQVLDGYDVSGVILLLRKENKLTQKDLARLTNLDQTYISLIENNKRLPSLEVLHIILQSLNTDFVSFFYKAQMVHNNKAIEKLKDLEGSINKLKDKYSHGKPEDSSSNHVYS